ncbi:glycosyl transferase family protein [Maridesulfovibrio hydrothermalis]|uniref:General secretory system II protein E domain protein n=1 Tax=Maridesulfovibrio hydrothermalis AM13 = DSM 14728 TaxID=1121451 RepID=L0RFQ3_9BACT|nr:glycosyl transferase family protein [Maridesulfovibrio hydrothermalis]CCO25025.1 General secretory system II protein E domain protein [Maridesulfovibrio hydrothermalis AM13 = DSM 14728]
MMFDQVFLFLFLGLKLTFLLVALVFVISGIDELFIDACYFGRALYRRLFILPRHKPLTEEMLLAKPEQSIAMMIPCWDESAVIRRMLENTLKTVTYSNYTIFVGTYPNDPATHREVELVRQKFGNVERIVCPKDGPTSKADCLNWLYEGIQLFEKDNNKVFDIFLMDDSEDIIHPLLLKLCNYVIPKLDMIQLPVHPMVRKWTEFTGNHYIDEFAENHTRDLIVREMLTGAVPSAGVGTGFSRKALKTISQARSHQLFDINSLTEDYDFGLKIKEFGLKQAFVRQWVLRNKVVKSFWGKPKQIQVREYISIKEFFPNTFNTAVRQKTRWVMGIALQGWTTLGWRGGFASRYMLLRDRKSLITNMANLTGNALVVAIISISTYNMFTDSYRLPPMVGDSPEARTLVSLCLFFLVWRILMRFLFVFKTYNISQALQAIPRLFWANIINFVATNRAIYFYTKSVITGEKAAWDKTSHVYPSEEELRAYRRKLGDLLLDKRFLTIEQLDSALAAKRGSNKKLGQILLDMNFISEDQLVQTLGVQFKVETQEIDPYVTPFELLQLVPQKVAVKYSIFPIAMENGELIIASSDMLDEKSLHELEQEIGHSVSLRLSVKSDISFAIRRGYERLSCPVKNIPLGQRLVESGLVTNEVLQKALQTQRRQYRPLGEVLIDQKVIDEDSFEELKRDFIQQKSTARIGDFLISKGAIDSAQLQRGLKVQKDDSLTLGEILVKENAISEEQLLKIIKESKDSDYRGV